MIGDIVLVIILVINLIATLLFIIIKRKDKNKSIAILFIILPILGFVIYFFMEFTVKYNQKKGAYDVKNHLSRFDVPKEVQKPNVEEELAVVAIGDALSVSTNTEKRKLILGQLKKNDQNSYRSLLIASRDEDSETAHYVATAKVSAYDKAYSDLRQGKNVYSDTKSQSDLLNLLKSISTMIKSGVLSNAEQKLYHIEYCDLIEQNMKSISKEYFDDYVCYLISLDRKDDLLHFWETFQPDCNSQFIYFKMLGFFYQIKDKANFYITLEQLRKSNIVLSSQGLRMLRFWMK